MKLLLLFLVFPLLDASSKEVVDYLGKKPKSWNEMMTGKRSGAFADDASTPRTFLKRRLPMSANETDELHYSRRRKIDSALVKKKLDIKNIEGPISMAYEVAKLNLRKKDLQAFEQDKQNQHYRTITSKDAISSDLDNLNQPCNTIKDLVNNIDQVAETKLDLIAYSEQIDENTTMDAKLKASLKSKNNDLLKIYLAQEDRLSAVDIANLDCASVISDAEIMNKYYILLSKEFDDLIEFNDFKNKDLVLKHQQLADKLSNKMSSYKKIINSIANNSSNNEQTRAQAQNISDFLNKKLEDIASFKEKMARRGKKEVVIESKISKFDLPDVIKVSMQSALAKQAVDLKTHDAPFDANHSAIKLNLTADSYATIAKKTENTLYARMIDATRSQMIIQALEKNNITDINELLQVLDHTGYILLDLLGYKQQVAKSEGLTHIPRKLIETSQESMESKLNEILIKVNNLQVKFSTTQPLHNNKFYLILSEQIEEVLNENTPFIELQNNIDKLTSLIKNNSIFLKQIEENSTDEKIKAEAKAIREYFEKQILRMQSVYMQNIPSTAQTLHFPERATSKIVKSSNSVLAGSLDYQAFIKKMQNNFPTTAKELCAHFDAIGKRKIALHQYSVQILESNIAQVAKTDLLCDISQAMEQLENLEKAKQLVDLNKLSYDEQSEFYKSIYLKLLNDDIALLEKHDYEDLDEAKTLKKKAQNIVEKINYQIDFVKKIHENCKEKLTPDILIKLEEMKQNLDKYQTNEAVMVQKKLEELEETKDTMQLAGLYEKNLDQCDSYLKNNINADYSAFREWLKAKLPGYGEGVQCGDVKDVLDANTARSLSQELRSRVEESSTESSSSLEAVSEQTSRKQSRASSVIDFVSVASSQEDFENSIVVRYQSDSKGYKKSTFRVHDSDLSTCYNELDEFLNEVKKYEEEIYECYDIINPINTKLIDEMGDNLMCLYEVLAQLSSFLKKELESRADYNAFNKEIYKMQQNISNIIIRTRRDYGCVERCEDVE